MNELKKEEKSQVVSELQGKFQKAKGVVFTDYRGLNVEEISGLRNGLRSAALEYKVVKNTLAKIAAEGTPVSAAKDSFTGPVGIAIGYDDPVLLVKKVLEYNRTNEKLQIKGGVIEGGFCSVDVLKKISELPPREVQLSMLAGTLQAPASKFARLLNATLVRFAYAVEALKQKRGE
ncbi:MAG: 50S ribosomal protein L10 [Nitrospiraceae bacterium]|nr:MAG: 50S ribosomal protein L10 [Nitrospiraceae bacterium]